MGYVDVMGRREINYLSFEKLGRQRRNKMGDTIVTVPEMIQKTRSALQSGE